MIQQIHHLAVGVHDLDKAINILELTYGFKVDRRVIIKDRQIEAALFKVGETWLECLAPISKNSSLDEFLKENGEGFHHIAYLVDSIEKVKEILPQDALLPLRASSVGNWMIADIASKYSVGLKAQLIQKLK